MKKLNNTYYLFGDVERLYAIKCMLEVNKKFKIYDGVEQFDNDITRVGWNGDGNYIKVKVNDIKEFKKFYKNYIYSYRDKNYGPGSICIK